MLASGWGWAQVYVEVWDGDFDDWVALDSLAQLGTGKAKLRVLPSREGPPAAAAPAPQVAPAAAASPVRLRLVPQPARLLPRPAMEWSCGRRRQPGTHRHAPPRIALPWPETLTVVRGRACSAQADSTAAGSKTETSADATSGAESESRRADSAATGDGAEAQAAPEINPDDVKMLLAHFVRLRHSQLPAPPRSGHC